MDEQRKAPWDWGNGPPAPPSVERVDARGWLCASFVAGVAAGVAVLVLAWRPLPLLALPPGSLGEHAVHWAAMGCHAVGRRLCVGAAAEYVDVWARMPDAERRGLICRCACAAWAALMPAVLMAESFLRARDGLIDMRGARRRVGADAVKALAAAVAARAKRRPDHEVAPGISYPAELWTRGTLVVGGVGSGKSTALRPLIDKVVASGEQMLLFDAKSEFTSGWAGPAIVAPWDARSLAWDIAKDVRNVLEMERFAGTMIRDSTDPMWSSASRQILVGLMLCLRGSRGTDWGWADLRDMLSMPQHELLATMQAWHPIAARSLAKASVTSAGILINLAAFCAPIFHLAEAWGAHPPERRVSIVEWTLGRSPHRQLVLQGHGSYGELARACAEGIVGVFASLVASVEMPDDARRKVWLIADEVVQLGKLPMAAFSLGRSRGVRAIIATQDLAQLEEVYGAPAVKALVSMVGTLIVGQTMQGESAELLCKAFGSREVERANLSAPQGGPAEGRQATLSFSRDEVPLYKPTELSSRLGLSEDGQSVRLILFTGGVAYELSWPLFHMRQDRPAHVPAAWTRAARAPIGLSGKPEPRGMAGDSVSDGANSAGDDFDDRAALPVDDASVDDPLDEVSSRGQ